MVKDRGKNLEIEDKTAASTEKLRSQQSKAEQTLNSTQKKSADKNCV